MSIVLDAVNKTLEIVLAGVVAANQLPFVASYADYDDAAPGFTPGENDGLTNNAVVVTLVAAPGAGEQRLVNNISIFNRDTVAADVTIQYDNAGVDREIVKVNLAVGYSLHFREDQWQVLDTNGAVRMVLDTGVALQHDILSNTHGDAAVDAVTRGSIVYGNATPKWDELVIGGATEYLKSDGVDASWAVVDFDDLSGDCDLADLAGYARGSIIRGGAVDWEAHVAETNHFILVGDGVDVSSKAFDWDDMAAGAGADMVHSHQAAGEGGQIDHGLALTGLGDDDHTQYLLADGTRALSGPWAPGQIITMINEGLHILDTDASHDLIIKAGSDLTVDRILSLITGDAARTVTLTGNPTLDDWFDQSVKQAATPVFGGVSLPTVTFNGASGANIITVPDNFADALHLSDAGGIEYVKIISTDAQPVIRFNDGGVDVDFEVEAVGVADALQVRGADGQITLGVLTSGFVKSSAGGVLSMAAEVALAELASYTQGDLIVGGAADWTDLAIGGAHQILKVNAGATDPAWASFDWDDMAAGAGADMVHDHSVAGEGGEIPLASLGSCIWGRMVIGGAANWTTLGHPGFAGYALISNVNSFIWNNTPNWGGLHTFNAGAAIAAGQGLAMGDASWLGIIGNELLTVNAAGNFTFSGITSLVVPDGCWVGADAACSWVFDSTNGDVTTLDKVGIGLAGPTYPLHILGAPGIAWLQFSANTSYAQFGFVDETTTQQAFFGYIGSNFGVVARRSHFEIGTTSSDIYFRPGDAADLVTFAAAGTVTMSNYGIGDAQFLAGGVITSVSDRSLKQDIHDTEIGLVEVLQMQGKSWRFTEASGLNDKDDTRYQGFIADDIEKIVPNAVGRDAHGMKTMSYSSLMPAFAKAFRELNVRLEKLEARA